MNPIPPLQAPQQQQPNDDLFFDANADDEDEAYVYQHLRSGMMETIHVVVSQPEPTATLSYQEPLNPHPHPSDDTHAGIQWSTSITFQWGITADNSKLW